MVEGTDLFDHLLGKEDLIPLVRASSCLPLEQPLWYVTWSLFLSLLMHLNCICFSYSYLPILGS